MVQEGQLGQIDGRLELRRYTAQDGAVRTSTDIIADGFLNLTSREERADALGAQRRAVPAGNRPMPVDDVDPFADLDDVPF